MNKLFTLALVALLISLPMSASARVKTGQTQKGLASYYHDSLNGNRTASGEIYNKRMRTAAHKSLPLGTKVRVTKLSTGKSIVVKINDRGPFVKGRIIDLSRRAARDLGIIKRGVAKVKVEVLSVPKRKRR
ncbi:MAG: septal ring lytic transglycosylase RlpA family protein [Chromatiaceae bacterium]|jgi:rare lipoprotein A|nr:septal ring lytic transglycosylase RlpA family protein [Chromatiaceae bacterium]